MNRGFTLLELMIVVLLIAILAVIAAPTMAAARNDRLAWNYARQYQSLIHRARSHAAGRGAAHLIIFGPGPGAGRGYGHEYEALDGPPVGTTPGPNPVSSCKGINQWTAAIPDNPPTANDPSAHYVDFVDLNGAGINDQMDVMTSLYLRGTVGAPPISSSSTGKVDYLAICITPLGVTYAGSGADPASAITMMRESLPLNDVAEVRVTRRTSGTPVGLNRRVIIAGAAAPRLKSE